MLTVTWGQAALTIIGYWALVITVWWFYTTRPSQQARARAAATTETLPAPHTRDNILILSATTNLTGLVVALIGPPLIFVLVHLAR